MSDGDEAVGLDNAGMLWSGGGDQLLDGAPPEKEVTEIDPDTGEVKGKTLKPLTLREELFVREYCKSFDKKAVGKKFEMHGPAVAGMLARKNVAHAVHTRAMEIAKSMDMDENWVMRNIREVVERCMGDGLAFDPGSALRGLELVGKRFAMFTDKKEINETKVIRIVSNVGVIPGVTGPAVPATPIDITPTNGNSKSEEDGGDIT